MAGHSHAQENDSKKRKADALNPNPDTAGHTKKKPYQNGTISAREFSPEPRPASRPIPEQVACTPLAPRALTATVSAGETALIDSPYGGPNHVPNSVNPRAGAFTVANQLQGSVSPLATIIAKDASTCPLPMLPVVKGHCGRHRPCPWLLAEFIVQDESTLLSHLRP